MFFQQRGIKMRVLQNTAGPVHDQDQDGDYELQYQHLENRVSRSRPSLENSKRDENFIQQIRLSTVIYC